MKVSRAGGAKETAGPKRKVKTSQLETENFVTNLRETQNAPSASMTAESAAVSGAEVVLAAQNVGDASNEASRKKRLIDFADDILDRLDELQAGILLGRFSKERLTELAQKLRQKRQQSADEALNQIIHEVELRAEVEIAKYSRRSKEV